MPEISEYKPETDLERGVHEDVYHTYKSDWTYIRQQDSRAKERNDRRDPEEIPEQNSQIEFVNIVRSKINDMARRGAMKHCLLHAEYFLENSSYTDGSHLHSYTVEYVKRNTMDNS